MNTSPKNQTPDYNLLDESTTSFQSVARSIQSFVGRVEDEHQAMEIDQITISSPFEVDVHVTDDGEVVLGTTTPTQSIETSYTPVFHNLKVTLVKEEDATRETDK